MRRLRVVAGLGAVLWLLAAPLAVAACPGVRPGAFIRAPKGDCTLDFLFRAGSGRRYAGTAGHCVIGNGPLGYRDEGGRTWSGSTGPVIRDAGRDRIGTVAYARVEGEGDFALIRLDRGVTARPAVCGFGGPTGIDADRTASPAILHLYGNGVGISQVAPARTLLALSMPDPRHVFAWGPVTFGDSGGPVLARDGRAVGLVVTLGLHGGAVSRSGADLGLVGITRLRPELRQAEDALDRPLALMTASPARP